MIPRTYAARISESGRALGAHWVECQAMPIDLGEE
jgi:hypothetical protein